MSENEEGCARIWRAVARGGGRGAGAVGEDLMCAYSGGRRGR